MIVEVLTFRLASGVTDEEFTTLDAAYQAELMINNAGFIRRTVARDGAEWAVVTFWWLQEEAERAGADTSEPSRAFREAIDRASMKVARYETLE